jgi:hypothetical protein
MQNKTAAYILNTIENLEKEIAFLKTLVQQAISEEEHDEQDQIIVDATFADDDEILGDAVEGDAVEPDVVAAAERKPAVAERKPAARKLTRKQQREEARTNAKAWAEAERLAKLKRT